MATVSDENPSPEALNARKLRQEALDNVAERKLQTRRKIIVGAISLKLAREDEIERNQIMERITRLSDNDKKLFDGYFENTAID